MKIIGYPSMPLWTQELAQNFNHEIIPACFEFYPNEELSVSLKRDQVSCQTILITYSPQKNINASFFELLLVIHTVKALEPQSINLVLPYYLYGRQDSPLGQNSPAHFILKMLKGAGIDSLITIDIHNKNIFKQAPFKTFSLTAAPLFSQEIINYKTKPLIVSPDQGGINRAKALANILKTDYIHLEKKRMLDKRLTLYSSFKQFKGRYCIIIDDIIDSGSTLSLTADYLIEQGAYQVEAFVTHGIFSQNALENINTPSLLRLTITDTLLLRKSVYFHPKIKVVKIAPFLGDILKKLHG